MSLLSGRDLLTACALGALLSVSVACSGGDSAGAPGAPPPVGSPPPPPPPPPPPAPPPATIMESPEEAARFAIQASFGADFDEVQAMVGMDAAAWLEAEFSKAPTLMLPELLAEQANGTLSANRPHSPLLWNSILSADDVLRQRMVFALSQILVVSDIDMGGDNLRSAHYLDILSRNAFGNYRDLLEEVTYSPAMGTYLTYIRNRKANPRTGRMPDENYARELLQLFTIGLVELNMDGTIRQGVDGPVELFDNTDIEGLARVFTGLARKGSRFGDPDPDGDHLPMQVYPEQHSELDKAFLGTVIPAGTSAEESIDLALDEIFAQPSVAPFISRQLIQRFTASDPDPAYVERVATAFEAGQFTAPDGTVFGTGQRGDLKATLSAVLLDPSQHEDLSTLQPGDGKLREPILKFAHFVRAFDLDAIDAANEFRLNNTVNSADRLGQHPFRSPSVFNFYRPGFIAPGTVSGAANLTAPELQVVNEGTAIGFLNFVTEYVLDRSPSRDGGPSFVPDYSGAVAVADDAAALVDRLSLLLTAGRLTDAERTEILAALETIEITTDEADDDRTRRVVVGIIMIMSTASFGLVQ